MQRRYRIVIAKPGLDGHDRGAKVIARALRDAGFEVIYTGLFQTPDQVAEAALQEDADAVGLSVLSGRTSRCSPRSWSCSPSAGRSDVLVFGGGIIPPEDIEALEHVGVARMFTPGAPLAEITTWLEHALDDREAHGDNTRDSAVVDPAPSRIPSGRNSVAGLWTCTNTKASSCSRSTASRCRRARRW